MSTGGLSTARLGRMHDVMAGYVERGDVPGLVTLVSRRGETHVDALGTMAVGGRDPMRRDTIFHIASMTKPITAAAAMILVEKPKPGRSSSMTRPGAANGAALPHSRPVLGGWSRPSTTTWPLAR